MAIQRSVVIRLVADVRGMSAGMDEAERSVTRLDRRVAAMTRAVRAAAAESAQASQRVAAAKRVEASMTERAAAAEQRATSVRAAASAAATRVGEAEARLADVRAAGTAEMASRVTAAEERVTSVRRQAEAAASRVGQAEARLAELRAGGANVSAAELSAAERRVEQARATAAAAADRVGIAESRLAELRAASGASAAEVAAAERRVEAARARHEAVTNAAASAEQRLTAAQEMQARAAAQVTAAEERATAATNAHAAAAQRSIARTQAWNAAAGKMAMVGGTIGLGLGLAVKQFMDFDEAMSGVRANLSGTPAEMDAVQNAVRQAGAASVFSATEAANAAEELAKAGLKAADITGGALTGSMDLAAAGGVGLARAAEVAATAMAQFHLKGQDVAHIADVMAAGALASTASIDSLAQGMAQGGGMAASLGMSLEQTVGALSLFDQNALKGSDGGTSLKTMLMSLTPNSEAAATAMEDIGLQAFDANGKFVGLTSVAEQLKNGMKDMGEEQRLAALKTIFGADAARAANVLYQEGAAGLQDYINKVSESGVAAQVAAAKLNNAKGDLEKLKGDFENVLIGAGEGANGPIRGLIQNVDKLVSAFGELPSGVQSGVVQIAAFGSAGLLAAAGVIKMVNAIRSIRSGVMTAAGALRDGVGAFTSWVRAGDSSGTMLAGLRGRATQAASAIRNMGVVGKVGLGLLAAGLIAAGVAAATAGPQIDNFGRSGADLGRDLRTAADGGKNFDSIFSNMSLAAARDQSLSLSEATKLLGGNYDKVDDKADKFFTGMLKGVGAASGAANSLEAVKGRFKGVGDELASLVQGGRADEAARQFSALAQAMAKNDTGPGWDKSTSAADRYKAATKALMGAMPGYSDALARASTEQKKNADATNAAALSAVKAGNANDQQKKSVDDLADSYKNLNNLLLQQRADARGYQAALDAATDALKENGRTLDITTEKGRNNQEALDSIASSAGEWAASVLKSTGDQQRANSILQDGRQQYTDMAMAMGRGREEATKLANEMVKIDGVNTVDVKVDGVEAAIYGVNVLGEQVIRLKGTSLEIPASVENGPQVLQMMAAIKDLRLSEDGKTMTVTAEAMKVPETKAAIESVPGIVHNKDGSVTVDVKELGADVANRAIGELSTVARMANGQIVHIPAGTNAPAIKSLIEGLGAKSVAVNGTQVKINTSAPLANADREKINKLKGAAVSANGTMVTIDSKAITGPALADLNRLMSAAQNKTVWITTYTQTIPVGIRNPNAASNAASGGVTGLPMRGGATGGAISDLSSLPRFASGGYLGRINGKPYGWQDGRDGGRVRGPGTATSDQVVTMTSRGLVRTANDEHIIAGDEVAGFGGHAGIYRMRQMAKAGVLRRFASGGSVDDDWTPDMSGIMAYAASLKVDPSAVTEQRKKVADQKTALDKAIRDLRAAQAGVRGKSGAARVKAENAVATAIERQAKATQNLSAARSKLAGMEARSGQGAGRQFISGISASNWTNKRFLDDIERIKKRGFPMVARSLLEDGSDSAVKAAHSFAVGERSELVVADRGLKFSDAQADRKSKLLDDLKGISTGEVADQARAQANAQLIAMQAANQRIAWASGPTTARLEARLDVLADAIRSQPAPIVQASPVKVITQLDSRPIAESTFGHGAREAQWGSVLPGAEGGW
ncbi:phage tail tape measure protein [Dermacoccus sp. UBA1591]|uniref:phage tail tape measure protein n=1 Tax=Dermacoccus sp. UBA1591 TaxID=1946405 RepID=UPI00257D25CB|nr:phage tail tape measure protein [Dermacoccus sp. UBA1591]